MRNPSKKAFTLTEFIVTSVMVCLVGTISYFSYIGYSESTRDSIRSGDILEIIQSIEYYKLSHLRYPEPHEFVNISYSGATIWSQGTFGYEIKYKSKDAIKIPIDPSTGNQYAYSVSSIGREYQIAALYETFIASYNLINEVHADSLEMALAYVRGNYNGAVAKASDGTNTYALALPSLLSSNLAYTEIEDIIENNSLVYHGGSNLTDNYKNSLFETKGGFIFNSPHLVFYKTTDTKKLSKESEQILFFKNLRAAYEGTSVANDAGVIQNIIMTDTETRKEKALKISQSFIYNFIDRTLKTK